MHRAGIRELRANAAAVVRRAGAGEETVITVGGRAVARLGPLAGGSGARSVDDLVAQGLLLAPRRTGAPSDVTVPVWGTVRLDRLLREIRG